MASNPVSEAEMEAVVQVLTLTHAYHCGEVQVEQPDSVEDLTLTKSHCELIITSK